MNTKLIAAGSLAGLLVAGGLVGTVSAQTAAEETGLTAEEAIAIALSEIPGEVQELELELDDGMEIYEIEILSTDGDEMEIEIAAATGEILEIEMDGDGHDDGDDDDDDDDDEDDA